MEFYELMNGGTGSGIEHVHPDDIEGGRNQPQIPPYCDITGFGRVDRREVTKYCMPDKKADEDFIPQEQTGISPVISHECIADGDKTFGVLCKIDAEIGKIADHKEAKQDSAGMIIEQKEKESDDNERRDNIRKSDPGKIVIDGRELKGRPGGNKGGCDDDRTDNSVTQMVFKGQ